MFEERNSCQNPMALFSKTKIANLALSHLLDKSNLENIETQTDPQAVIANLWYDVARMEVLEDFNWKHARKRQTLAAHGDAAPTAEWAYRYQWPSSCVAPRYIENPGGPDADAVPGLPRRVGSGHVPRNPHLHLFPG